MTDAQQIRGVLGDIATAFSPPVFIVVTLVAASSVPANAQQYSQIYIEVLDGSGQPLPNLQPSDFQVRRDETEVTIVSAVLDDAPMKIALLVDNGGLIGVGNALIPLRDAMATFLDTLPPEHEVGLFTIGRSIQRRVDFTSDRGELADSAAGIFPDSAAGTVFLDGIRETWERRFDEEDTFPVLVVLATDNAEISSNYTDNQYSSFVNDLIANGVAVHVVLFSSQGGSAITQYAVNLTQNTGGLYSVVAAATALPEAMTELATQLGDHFATTSKRYRVVYEVPDPPGDSISAGVRASGTVRLFVDRRMP